MSPELLETVITELAKNAPSFLWWILVLVVVLLFYKRIRDDLLPNLSGFKAAGVELSFLKKTVTSAIELAEKSPKWPVTIPEKDKQIVLERVKNHAELLQGTKILWIDDAPDNNRNETKMFIRLGVDLEFAQNTQQALAALREQEYDLILSDMAREDEAQAGIKFLQAYAAEKQRLAVIFYIGVFKPERGIPPGAFGITNRPDEMLHLVLDALERRKS